MRQGPGGEMSRLVSVLAAIAIVNDRGSSTGNWLTRGRRYSSLNPSQFSSLRTAFGLGQAIAVVATTASTHVYQIYIYSARKLRSHQLSPSPSPYFSGTALTVWPYVFTTCIHDASSNCRIQLYSQLHLGMDNRPSRFRFTQRSTSFRIHFVIYSRLRRS